MSPPWQPVLEGDDAAEALAVAAELGTILRDLAVGGHQDDPTLSRGMAGWALALAYLDGAFPDRGFAEAADVSMRAAAQGVATLPLGTSLMQGFTGVAWTLAHLTGRRGESVEDDLDAIDAALLRTLREDRLRGGYDLISGLVGVGIYALERLPASRPMLELVIDRLAARAERDNGSVTWFTPPEDLPDDARARAPGGYYNLGMAHGVPGAAGLLARAGRAGVDLALELLDGTLAWLESQTLPEDSESLLPYFVGPGLPASPARLAWCYGDPGAAAGLLLSDRPAAGRLASRAVERMLNRPARLARVRGASLCHGTSGLAQLYGRLYAATGDDRLAEAARRQIAATLDLRRSGEGLAGFTVWDPADTTEGSGDVQGPGWLAGIAGVALALTAAATADEPAWDRALVISGGATT